jgi:hypothetical protein
LSKQLDWVGTRRWDYGRHRPLGKWLDDGAKDSLYMLFEQKKKILTAILVFLQSGRGKLGLGVFIFHVSLMFAVIPVSKWRRKQSPLLQAQRLLEVVDSYLYC